MLDQHRDGLKGQLRADLQNYLVAKSQMGSTHGSSRKMTDRYKQGIAATTEGHIDLRSDRLVRNTPLTAGSVKALHDSCYVSPDQNHRVIQDHNPAKSEAWKQALQRHEEQV